MGQCRTRRELHAGERRCREFELLKSTLEENRSRMDAILGAVRAVLWERNWGEGGASSRLVFMSPNIKSMTGYPAERWLENQRFWLEIMHPDDRERVEKRVPGIIAAGGGKHQYRWLTADARELRIETHFSVLRGPDGRPRGLRGISLDVTAQRQAEDDLRRHEEKLRQSQKLESLGRLAGGIAHDFNNILTAIHSSAHFLSEELAPGDARRQDVDDIRAAAERAAAITRQLLAFSRRQPVAPKMLSVNGLLGAMELLLRRLIREDITFEFRLDPGLRPVRVDPTQMEQVIFNLAANARDAMPKGGTVHISTKNLALSQAEAHGNYSIPPGSYAVLSISDTGHGMDEPTLRYLFEPFFTTKEPGRGTGLGLSMVYGIIKQAEGFITVDSAPGRGTEFSIYLPHAAGRLDETSASKKALPRERGSETILFAEDNPQVRDATSRILRAHGYRVLEASRGDEALEAAAHHAGPIHLLLSDVIMPGFHGPELFERLSKLRPETKVLFVSGYPETPEGRHRDLRSRFPFLSKPYVADELLAKVADILRA